MFLALYSCFLASMPLIEQDFYINISQTFSLRETKIKQFPKAFTAYSVHCKPLSSKAVDVDHHQRSLAGTALLIPPSPPRENRWVACLFTSVGYGRSVDSVEQIVTNTEHALADLARQIEELQSNVPDGAEAVKTPAVFAPDKVEATNAGLTIGSCWSVRLNSGKFGVEWSRTKAVLERGTLDIQVVRPPSEDHCEAAAKNQKRNGGETQI